jgi:hypothetical protein
MNVLTTNLTANEIEFYKFAIEASLDCGHVTIEDIQNTGCQLTENQIKGYVGSLTKKGLIVPDYEYKSIFYVYVAFSDCDGVTATFYGENLEDVEFEAIQRFIDPAEEVMTVETMTVAAKLELVEESIDSVIYLLNSESKKSDTDYGFVSIYSDLLKERIELRTALVEAAELTRIQEISLNATLEVLSKGRNDD